MSEELDALKAALDASLARAEKAELAQVNLLNVKRLNEEAIARMRARLIELETERDAILARLAGDLSEGALLNDLDNIRRVLQNLMRDTCGPDHEHCTSCYEAEEALGMSGRWIGTRK